MSHDRGWFRTCLPLKTVQAEQFKNLMEQREHEVLMVNAHNGLYVMFRPDWHLGEKVKKNVAAK